MSVKNLYCSDFQIASVYSIPPCDLDVSHLSAITLLHLDIMSVSAPAWSHMIHIMV